jgi:hypothetical protein
MASNEHDDEQQRGAQPIPEDTVPPARRDTTPKEGPLFRGIGVLCEAAVRLTGVDGAAVAVMMSPQSRELVFATDAVAQQIDDLQFIVGEGPCFDAYHLQSPQLCPGLDPHPRRDRWLPFSAGVQDLGVHAVFAFPVPGPLGVLELYRRRPGALDNEQFDSAATCAEAIGHMIGRNFPATLSAISAGPATAEAASLHPSNPFGRPQVHRACSLIARQLNISPDEALARMRAHAYAHDMSIHEAAAEILDQRFPLQEWDDQYSG